MFIKLTRNNSHKEDKEILINTDKIISVTETHQEPTYLYDSEGNVAQTINPTKKFFKVVLEGGIKSVLNETEYQKLVNALVK